MNLLDECLVDNDCPFSKACRNEECIDPCSITLCGERALCKSEYHSGICYCPPGTQGNPIVKCLDVGCQRDDDCSSTERCNLISGNCVPLCQGQVCAQGARCQASNHKELCTCIPPLYGDGHVYCTQSKKVGFCTLYLVITMLF